MRSTHSHALSPLQHRQRLHFHADGGPLLGRRRGGGRHDARGGLLMSRGVQGTLLPAMVREIGKYLSSKLGNRNANTVLTTV